MTSGLTDAWTEQLTHKITDKLVVELRNGTLLDTSKPFDAKMVNKLLMKDRPNQRANVLERMVGGYLREFVRQTDEDIGEVNASYKPGKPEMIAGTYEKPDISDPYRSWAVQDETISPGIFHSKALLKKAISLGMDMNEAVELWESVVAMSVDEFKHQYMRSFNEFGQASIAEDKDAVKAFAIECMLEKQAAFSAR